jgi:hypothetical protein
LTKSAIDARGKENNVPANGEREKSARKKLAMDDVFSVSMDSPDRRR